MKLRIIIYIQLILLAVCTASAGDIKAVDGLVKFYLNKSHAAARYNMNVSYDNWSTSDFIIVNNTKYPVQEDTDGRFYINVQVKSDSVYQAVYMPHSSGKFFNSNGTSNVIIPYSQFLNTTVSTLSTFPMYAQYSRESGDELTFNDGYAVIDIVLKGNGEQIKSVKIENKDDSYIAGISSYNYSNKALVGSTIRGNGMSYVVLNCTNQGDYKTLSDTETHFYIPVYAKQYSEGLYVRISDMNHRMMEFDIAGTELTANQLLQINKTYTPDEDLVFFEGFDNFVWGGDIVAGSLRGKRFSYTSSPLGTTADDTRTGYEESLSKVDYDAVGTGYMQSNTWGDVNNYNLTASHAMSDSYLTSRGIWDYRYLFRAQEYSGYISIGTASTTRGIFQTPNFKNITGLRNITVEFDIAVMYGLSDNLDFRIQQNGIIEEVYIDDKKIELTADNYKKYNVISSNFYANRSLFKIPLSASSVKTWHHVKMNVSGADNATSLFLQGNTAATAYHGFYIDNIEVRQGEALPSLERGDVRVLYWNIQNGMWADQGNNYDNFVKWVKQYSPDICVWCESRSNFVTGSTAALSSASSYLPNKGYSSDNNTGWAELAARYGHDYASLGGHRDNYPQEVTSKYPITTLLKITNSNISGKPVSHGAALQQVNVDGTKFNFITMHTWPQAYGYGVAAAKQAESAAKREGDYYREHEMNYVLNQTYLSDTYKNLSNWILLGDFNSISIADNDQYGHKPDTCLFLCQNVVRNKTDLVDVVEEKYPGTFISSTHGSSRIDYIYVSPDLVPYIKNVSIIKDDWTTIYFSGMINFYYPSDHRPILIDFDFNQQTGISQTAVKDDRIEVARYDASGRAIKKNAKGFAIIKYNDGTTAKIFQR